MKKFSVSGREEAELTISDVSTSEYIHTSKDGIEFTVALMNLAEDLDRTAACHLRPITTRVIAGAIYRLSSDLCAKIERDGFKNDEINALKNK